MAALDTLTAEVSEAKTIMESAVTAITGLKAKLDEAIASGDPNALTALSAALDASGNALAAAISENTPAAPAQS